jgi:hypothetical protein
MGVFEQLHAEIEKRCLSSGGWASGNSRRAGIETTCYALMALHDRPSLVRDHAVGLLLRTQNPDGSWPAFEGDDPEGCWTTALTSIALRFIGAPTGPIEKSIRWLLNNQGRERSLVLEMEIPNGGSRSAVQPSQIRMAVVPGHR